MNDLNHACIAISRSKIVDGEICILCTWACGAWGAGKGGKQVGECMTSAKGLKNSISIKEVYYIYIGVEWPRVRISGSIVE